MNLKEAVDYIFQNIRNQPSYFDDAVTTTLVPEEVSAQLYYEKHAPSHKQAILGKEAVDSNSANDFLEGLISTVENTKSRKSYQVIATRLKEIDSVAFRRTIGVSELLEGNTRGVFVSYFVESSDVIERWSIFFPKEVVPHVYEKCVAADGSMMS